MASVQSVATKKHTLYWNPICPFVHRALIVLEEKGASAVPDRVHIPLGKEKPAWYAEKINPAGTVPTLTIEGEPTLFESSFIAEYFDRIFGQPNLLLPPVPQVRAAIREFQNLCGDAISALYGVFFSNDAAAAKDRAHAAVDKLEKALANRTAHNGGPFFLGTQFSMADVHIVPFLQRFSVTLPAYRDFDPFANASALRRLLEAASVRPSLYNTSLTPHEYVTAYGAYGGTKAHVDTLTVRLPAGSPFGRRLTVAAAMAGLTVRTEVLNAKAAVGQRLPSVSLAGTTAHDSDKAMEFLLESAPRALRKESAGPGATPLVPTDPVQHGRAQFIAQEADTLGTAVVMAAKRDAAADAPAKLKEALAHLEGLVAGPWAVGAEPSFADAVLYPFLRRVDKASLEADAPKLKAILDAASALPHVKVASHDDPEDYHAFVEAA